MAVETRNHQSLAVSGASGRGGKAPVVRQAAGDDFPAFKALIDEVRQRGLYLQMGYMFRYSPGFGRGSGAGALGPLGEVFSIHAHMSTNVKLAERTEQSRHHGGILYDLGGHMIDRSCGCSVDPSAPRACCATTRRRSCRRYSDNTLAVLEYPRALVHIEIAAMEATPTARRFEVFGTRGSALLEPFDPARRIYRADQPLEELPEVSRQQLYERELEAFVAFYVTDARRIGRWNTSCMYRRRCCAQLERTNRNRIAPEP